MYNESVSARMELYRRNIKIIKGKQMVKTGTRGSYTWFQSSSHYLSVLIDRVPDVVVGHYVAISAYEGEPLHLTSDEIKTGWQQHSHVCLSPIIQRPSEIPQNQFDEWYTFSSLKIFSISESFVNYGGFSLAPSNNDNPFLPESVRYQNAKENSIMNQRQRRFWNQIELCQPETYLAESDKLIIVCKNPYIIDQLKCFFAQSTFRLPSQVCLNHKLTKLYSTSGKKV